MRLMLGVFFCRDILLGEFSRFSQFWEQPEPLYQRARFVSDWTLRAAHKLSLRPRTPSHKRSTTTH
jgi:hypothetical protein